MTFYGSGIIGYGAEAVVERFAALRQYQRNGQRSPHKPLLVLLALVGLARSGSSSLPWSEVEPVLAGLIAEFAPPSRTSRAQSAAYPFTRLRTDEVWVLDHDVPMDLVVLSNFPETIAPDVLEAAGLDPQSVLGSPDAGPADLGRAWRRSPGWRTAVLQAWDRQCAFCGYDGQLSGATAALDAAHVRWFSFDGPDVLDNGLALCALHHKLFDLGVLGFDGGMRVQVSAAFTARTAAGRALTKGGEFPRVAAQCRGL